MLVFLHIYIKYSQHQEMRKKSGKFSFYKKSSSNLIFLRATKNLKMFYFTCSASAQKVRLHQCRGRIFLCEIFILASSISYCSVVKKAKWFFDRKNPIFQNSKVENFKNLEILQPKRNFSKFLQAITIDTFILAN